VTLVDGQYKRFCIQVGGGDVGGSNYYWNATNGFKPTLDEIYTISFKVSSDTGEGKLRINGNGYPAGSDPWEKTQALTITPTDFTHSWTQGSGNLAFDTGDSTAPLVITITDIVITTP